MEAWQQAELIGGGDTLQHYHLADRGPFPIPCAAFYDTTTQSISSTTTAYALSCNTEIVNTLIRLDGSKFYVKVGGVFNIQFSAQLQNTDSQIHDAEIWLSKNGANVTESSSIVSVPNSHGGVDGHIIAAWNFFERMVSGDYFELMWRADNVAISIPHRAAASSPTRPSVPSLILTVQLVSI